VIRKTGWAHAAANSGCNKCSMEVRATDVTAPIRLTQHSPFAARSTMFAGNWYVVSLGHSIPVDDAR